MTCICVCREAPSEDVDDHRKMLLGVITAYTENFCTTIDGGRYVVAPFGMCVYVRSVRACVRVSVCACVCVCVYVLAFSVMWSKMCEVWCLRVRVHARLRKPLSKPPTDTHTHTTSTYKVIIDAHSPLT